MTLWTPMQPGDYILTEPIQVPSGATVDLRNITLRYPPNAGFGSLLDIAGASDVEVIGGVFDGNVGGQPAWQEHYHAVRVRNSANVAIHDSAFVNLSGDGVLVYEAASHVAVHHCSFRGENTNRNGVSITHARNCAVTDNSFAGMTRLGMPGPIDLEPDEPDQFVSDVQIARNEIVGTGQPVQAAINVYNAIANATIANITIEQNLIQGQFQRAIWIVGAGKGREQNIVIRDNEIRGLPTRDPIQVQDADAMVSGNVVEPTAELMSKPVKLRQKRRRRREDRAL